MRLVGTGGMGEVYEAIDLELGRIALKTIRADLVRRPGVLNAFRREVQLARRVSSPHVCRIYELFVVESEDDPQPLAFLTMEYLEGESLANRISQGALPWRKAERIAIQLCQGLTAIHASGTIHRDFKSGNVMLTLRNGNVHAVVTDFGLALESASAMAEQPILSGTPEYMAPEQLDRKATSFATDLYALGVVLYTDAVSWPKSSPPNAGWFVTVTAKSGRKVLVCSTGQKRRVCDSSSDTPKVVLIPKGQSDTDADTDFGDGDEGPSHPKPTKTKRLVTVQTTQKS